LKELTSGSVCSLSNMKSNKLDWSLLWKYNHHFKSVQVFMPTEISYSYSELTEKQHNPNPAYLSHEESKAFSCKVPHILFILLTQEGGEVPETTAQ